MYWAHKLKGIKSHLIESSALDGTNRQVVVAANESASSLSMDFSTERLYYVYVESGSIAYVGLKDKKVRPYLRLVSL